MSTLSVPVLDSSSRSKWPNLHEYGTDTRVLKYRVPTELRATCDLTRTLKCSCTELVWTGYVPRYYYSTVLNSRTNCTRATGTVRILKIQSTWLVIYYLKYRRSTTTCTIEQVARFSLLVLTSTWGLEFYMLARILVLIRNSITRILY